MLIKIVDEGYNGICVIFTMRRNYLIESTLHIILNDKSIPVKVIDNGDNVVFKLINENESQSNAEVNGFIANIFSFEKLEKLVG